MGLIFNIFINLKFNSKIKSIEKICINDILYKGHELTNLYRELIEENNGSTEEYGESTEENSESTEESDAVCSKIANQKKAKKILIKKIKITTN